MLCFFFIFRNTESAWKQNPFSHMWEQILFTWYEENMSTSSHCAHVWEPVSTVKEKTLIVPSDCKSEQNLMSAVRALRVLVSVKQRGDRDNKRVVFYCDSHGGSSPHGDIQAPTFVIQWSHYCRPQINARAHPPRHDLNIFPECKKKFADPGMQERQHMTCAHIYKQHSWRVQQPERFRNHSPRALWNWTENVCVGGRSLS